MSFITVIQPGGLRKGARPTLTVTSDSGTGLASVIPDVAHTYTWTGTHSQGGNATFSINWGDGTTTTPSADADSTTMSISAAHTFDDAGVYNIVLTVTDAQGEKQTSRIVATAAATAPAAPTILTATDAATGNVTFTAAVANGSDITKYQFRVESGGTWTDLDTPGDLTSPVTIAVLAEDDNLYLRAVNAVGNGAASAAFVVTAA